MSSCRRKASEILRCWQVQAWPLVQSCAQRFGSLPFGQLGKAALPFVGIYRSTSPWRIHLSAARNVVLHGSHQYTRVMLALIYQHQPDPSWDSSFWWVTNSYPPKPRLCPWRRGEWADFDGLVYDVLQFFQVSTKRRINMIQHDSTWFNMGLRLNLCNVSIYVNFGES